MLTKGEFGPLQGVRILDLSHVLNGPFATMLLAHMGAEVIKVEQRDAPDRFRHAWMPVDADHDGYEFLVVNANKRCITLNLKNEDGRKLFLDLVRKSDVVVENFSTGVMDRLGFGYEQLKEVNPSIIFASSKGYGETGPYAGLRSFATIAMAMSGWADASWKLSGARGTQVFGPGDEAAGVSMALGICAALYHRAMTGRGQKIEVSMQEALMGFMVSHFHEHFEGMGPAGAYMESKDGHIATHLPDMTDALFLKYSTALGHPEAIEDPRFATVAKRRENLKLLQNTVAEWMRKFTSHELFEIFSEQKVPAGPVLTIPEILDDPHIKAREAFVGVHHDEAGDLTLLAPWVRFSDTPARIDHAGAAVGQHNEEVYRELLGLTAGDLKDLEARGAI
ncbi:CoA transferase [Sphingobium jiangsuense]|uniref:Crotonobetainyl-CoA:carnitine CoA-transferase CaiB-like acyl-CoA transferase n=1 Tax=Sphingobium jiangsuense TaxID=870476 RepID=A0A7W6BCL2_9SPHN|nr:CaiB/BaiF CoA-transferase family protein [Sphingobium jiangsuense]MBB3924395.1 crotonobetainyl-CoA:carnitine CoA-transferase CaiB-like acyl-CoA transferase [Sphingobium jiangsuense]GLT00694.1 CoA transferase [Sphingobium jiangsuense]